MRTIFTILFSILLAISLLSALGKIFIRKPISYLEKEVEKIEKSEKPKHPLYDSEKILGWVLEQKNDSLKNIVQRIKIENPQLAKQIEQYLENIRRTTIVDTIENKTDTTETSNIKIESKEELHPSTNASKEASTTSDIVEPFLKLKIGTSNIFYTGEIHHNQANGKGKGVFDSGVIYKGEWENNSLNGEGNMTWADGSSYIGHFKNNKRNGLGTFVYKNDEKYIGEWKDDRRDGQGILYDKYGNVKYKGEWKADLFLQ
ncbi:MAG: hypothetical protein M9887_09510 [Chitinophagales bacterium]|nr:hypothetical protein [Chitinophagales bacterium]